MTPPLYDVLSGYWRSEHHVFAVTDDFTYARALLIERAVREAGGERVSRGLPQLEEALRLFDGRGFAHVTFGDYYYQIRRSQIVVAVGPMSTLRVA